MADTPPKTETIPPLWERYTRTQGRVHLTGLQAVIRLPLDRLRADKRDGRRTGAVFSGYPGSPLAGLDLKLNSLKDLLGEDVYLLPGMNEELAAAAISGTQLVDLFPHSKYDGVLGMWYGKAPGLDRALDALRHSNFTGTSRFGGAIAVVGDDPFCKSSSLPSHSEHAFAHAFMPLLAPADPADVLSLGQHAVEISRYAGLWTGLRIVADVADAGSVFELQPLQDVELPKFEVGGQPFAARLDTGLLPPHVISIEEDLIYGRLEAVRRYAYANGLNPITVRHKKDHIGLVAAGALYHELESALHMMGLGAGRLEKLGIRLMKLELLFPLEPRRLREFADGLDEIIVVDGKRGFIEEQIRATLFNEPDHPMVLGQRRETGEPWIARRDRVTAGTLALDLADHLGGRLEESSLIATATPVQCAIDRAEEAPSPSRGPHYCSGCPHGTSTRLPEGSVAGGGIGCHTMALLMDREVKYVGAMGTEGGQWIGMEPFADVPHIFQNLGDGTYFHSGRSAVRACVAAGSNITFKILYNGGIAMTGGQEPVGAKPLTLIVRDLLSDGVRRVVAMTKDKSLIALSHADGRVECVTQAGWDDAMRKIRKVRGVTVLVYDQMCSNKRQRLERRGVLKRAVERVMIDEDVCEGCGDCGVKSSCVSLHPIATALGRKTRVHESSCSDDRSCLDGDCPAFIGVVNQPADRENFEDLLVAPLPQPARADLETDRYEVLMVGIGSTGVVTVDALLVRAAELDGLYAIHMDQTGLAQRGGKVVSHCVISRRPVIGSPRVGYGRADVLLAFDQLGSSDRESRRLLDPERTRAVVHEHYEPTGAEIGDLGFKPPKAETFPAQLRKMTHDLVTIPAEPLAEAVLNQVLCANLVLLGSAMQRGLLPVSLESFEQAIRDNGVAVEQNLRALTLGRAVVAEPKLVAKLLDDASPPGVVHEDCIRQAKRVFGDAWERLESALQSFDCRTSLLEERVASFALDLRSYQSKRYAVRYLNLVRRLANAEVAIDRAAAPLTEAAARELYRIMAYKDEYEVARLLLRGPYRRWLGRHSKRRAQVTYNLHPPLLKAIGLKKKVRLGRWVEPILSCMISLRRLRGTWLDPFHRLPSRLLERELVGWYTEVLERLATHLCENNAEESLEIASLAGEIRGFEDMKASRVAWIRPQIDTKLATLVDAASTYISESEPEDEAVGDMMVAEIEEAIDEIEDIPLSKEEDRDGEPENPGDSESSTKT
ncbi:MAG: indolepyruvate ferredoxin oxidoreductase family protein [bacterium]|nr:indolepyruvate ferredoxin oxidoreductase family protein [bacterium]